MGEYLFLERDLGILAEKESQLQITEKRIIPGLLGLVNAPVKDENASNKLERVIDHLIARTTEIAEGYIDVANNISPDATTLRILMNYHAKRNLHYARALRQIKDEVYPLRKSSDTQVG